MVNHSIRANACTKMQHPLQISGAYNAFYVQLPISHGKTATPSGCGRLYRVWGRLDTQDRAFTA